MADPQAIVAWFKEQRGIELKTLRAFGVGNDRGNVTFPYPNGVKQRPDPTVPLQEGQRRFYFSEGKAPELFVAPRGSGKNAWLVEGETDAMRLWQESAAAGNDSSIFGIGGINTWKDEFAERYFSDYERVFVVLDNDTDYMVQGQVEEVWRKIRYALGGKVKRVRLPHDVKDVCEFFDRYDLDTLRMLTEKAATSRFKPVDFTVEPPPIRWFLDQWVAMGDVTIVAGDGGLGKSFLTMDWAVGSVSDRAQSLDVDMNEHGNVLYVDEENPQDVVYDRLLKLGLDPMQHSSKLRYLWNQGIKLDLNPDLLIDEAMEFRPSLVVLDSLTRLHSKEENASGDIAPLFNDAIQPLARDVGAAVVLIHHHDKAASGPRGSTDIRNSADCVIECYRLGEANPNKFRMKLTKSRRVQTGKEIIVGIEDQPDGTIRVVTDPIIDPPF